MMSYYQNIGQVVTSSPMPENGRITIPSSVLDSIPYLLRNLPLDDIAFAGPNTVTRDSDTEEIMIDTQDAAAPLPSSEWALRVCPAIMRVMADIGGTAVEGFLVDCRQTAVFNRRYSGLIEGTDGEQFSSMRESLGIRFPLGVLLNNAGVVHYAGHPEVEDAAKSMMTRVDTFIKQREYPLHVHQYLVPSEGSNLKPSTEVDESEGQNESVRTINPPRSRFSIGLRRYR
jgi:hypothetical protein